MYRSLCHELHSTAEWQRVIQHWLLLLVVREYLVSKQKGLFFLAVYVVQLWIL